MNTKILVLTLSIFILYQVESHGQIIQDQDVSSTYDEIGNINNNGQGFILNEHSYNLLIKEVESGKAYSQYLLGASYYFGNGVVKQDYKEAIKWLRKSIENGDYNGVSLLISYYGSEIDGNPNYEEAFKWAKIGAEKDDGMSQFMLGGFYWFGAGVEKNVEEAKKWLKKAAAKGIIEAKQFLYEIEK
jgi:TPR repeat protein